MDAFEQAARQYEYARRLLAMVEPLRADNDELRWAAEDLEEVLLDLKQAVMDRDEERTREHHHETRDLMRIVAMLSENIP